MMNPLYSAWNNALDYSRYPRGNTAPTVLPQMHYRYRGSTVQSVPSPRYYREILPIPTVITAVTAVLPHSPLPCHSLICNHSRARLVDCSRNRTFSRGYPNLMRSYGGLLEPRGSNLTPLKSTFNAEHFIRRLSCSILNGFGAIQS